MPPVAVVVDVGDGLVIVCFIVVNVLCCSSVTSFSGIVAVVAFVVVVFVVVSCGCGSGEEEGETLD